MLAAKLAAFPSPPPYNARAMKLRHLVRCLAAVALLSSCLAQAPKETAPPKVAETKAPPPATPHPLTAADVEAFLDAAVPMQLERENIAGAVVAVVKDGQVIFEKGYGYADVKAKKPVSPTDTLFRPGSISKLFTWTAVMQLVEQGKLDLDRDVNDYLDFKIPPAFGKPITLRDLMTHTPGFEETDKDLFTDQQKYLLPLRDYMSTHIPRRIFVPGTTPAYSNYGASLAGYIVQRVSGQPFDEYVEQHIFQPLNMPHSSFRQPLPANLAPLMSQGYQLGSGDAKGFEFINVPPAGSLSASADDITHFMIAHLQQGRYGSGQILQPATVEQMHARQSQTWSNPALNGMALGFYEETRNGHRIIGHGGDTVYFHSDLHLVQDANLGFFVSYNSAGRGEISPRTTLWRAFLDRYLPYEVPDIQPPSTAASDNASVLGSYQTSRRCDYCILRATALLGELNFKPGKDQTIVAAGLKAPNGQPRQWKEIAPLVYRDVNGQDKIAFTRMPDGTLRMGAGADIVVYESVPFHLRGSFVQTVIVGAIIVMGLTLVFWLVGALVRWHYQRPLPETEFGKFARVAVRLVCALDLLVLALWATWLSKAGDNISLLASHFDIWLHLLQVLQWIAIFATVIPLLVMLVAWVRTGLWWWARLYYTLIALACCAFVWLVFLCRLTDWSLRY